MRTISLFLSSGSSPRLRGTRGQSSCRSRLCRFIPAPAGNTAQRPPRHRPATVHPRACGEHVQNTSIESSPHGSSPRLRGTQYRSRRRGQRIRFIPAPAGNTASRISSAVWSSVHPRACGEHVSTISVPSPSFGSSPRLRGTLCPGIAGAMLVRFIPAPAGNTCRFSRSDNLLSVHPRACGEHGIRILAGTQHGGSSPRLRGTLAQWFQSRPA